MPIPLIFIPEYQIICGTGILPVSVSDIWGRARCPSHLYLFLSIRLFVEQASCLFSVSDIWGRARCPCHLYLFLSIRLFVEQASCLFLFLFLIFGDGQDAHPTYIHYSLSINIRLLLTNKDSSTAPTAEPTN